MSTVVNIEVVGVGFVPLDQLDPRAINAGKPVADTAGGYWTLATSSASVNHTSVEAVFNTPSMRWLIETNPATAISSLTGVVTANGPGAAATSLAANAVVTASITDANVTTAKVADANITAAKLATAVSAPIADFSPTLSATVVGSPAASLSVDVTAYGDGLYEVEFFGVVNTSSGPELLWQLNGADLTSPEGVLTQSPVSTGTPVASTLTQTGVFFNNVFVNNANTTLRVKGTISCRNGKLSGFNSSGCGKAGSTLASGYIDGFHTPAAVTTSIGLIPTHFDGTDRFAVGATLYVKKIAA
jgi:hypothetical protein